MASRRPIEIPTTIDPKKLFTSATYSQIDSLETKHHQPIETYSLKQQERLILQDMINLLQGINGYLIVSSPVDGSQTGDVTFLVDPLIDGRIRSMVEEILPLCRNLNCIVHFSEVGLRPECSQGIQAMAGFYSKVFRAFLGSVTSLDEKNRQDSLTLSQLVYHVDQPQRNINCLAEISRTVINKNLTGGQLINFLHEQVLLNEGDSRQILEELTKTTSQPFFDMVSSWCYRGRLVDPKGEFFVVVNRCWSVDELEENFFDVYWKKQYTIRPENKPKFMRSIVLAVINCGKIVNILRECGVNLDVAIKLRRLEYSKEAADVGVVSAEVASTVASTYPEMILTAVKDATKLLLDLLWNKYDLMAALYSMKRFFLLSEGDFMTIFMNAAERDLKIRRLNDLMRWSIEESIVARDKHSSDVTVLLLTYDLNTQLRQLYKRCKRVRLEAQTSASASTTSALSQSYNEFDQQLDASAYTSIKSETESSSKGNNNEPPTEFNLTGIESFSLNIKIDFPIKLVLNGYTIDQYQVILRHVFHFRNVERQLCQIWLLTKFSKRCWCPYNKWYSLALILRHRMLYFLQNFIYYMTNVCFEVSWAEFESSVKRCPGLDDVVRCHNEFLSRCLSDSLLMHPSLLKTLQKVALVIMNFVNFMRRFFKEGDILKASNDDQRSLDTTETLAVRRANSKQIGSRLQSMTTAQEFASCVNLFNDSFDGHVVNFFRQILELRQNNDERKLTHILLRLDFNGYYSRLVESFAVESAVNDGTGSKTSTPISQLKSNSSSAVETK